MVTSHRPCTTPSIATEGHSLQKWTIRMEKYVHRNHDQDQMSWVCSEWSICTYPKDSYRDGCRHGHTWVVELRARHSCPLVEWIRNLKRQELRETTKCFSGRIDSTTKYSSRGKQSEFPSSSIILNMSSAQNRQLCTSTTSTRGALLSTRLDRLSRLSRLANEYLLLRGVCIQASRAHMLPAYNTNQMNT